VPGTGTRLSTEAMFTQMKKGYAKIVKWITTLALTMEYYIPTKVKN
jgi:hypothetical protein